MSKSVLNISLIFLSSAFFVSCKTQPAMNLFLIEKDGKNCSAKIFDVDKKESTTWFQTTGCPKFMDSFLFDSNKRRAVFLHNGKYWTVDWKKNAKPEVFAEAYKLPAPKDMISSTIWMDRETGVLRAGFLVEFPHELSKKPQTEWWLTKFPNLADELANRPQLAPGIPSVGLIVELGTNGKWKELAAKLTTSQSDVAPGMAVLSTDMIEKTGTFRAQNLLMKNTCANQNCVATGLNFSAATKEWIQKTFKSQSSDESDQPEPPTFGYHPMSENDGFIYNLALGDTYHAVPPVFYCQGTANKLCETREPTSLSEQQLSFSGMASYVLVSEEYSGLKAQIFKSGSKKVYHSFAKSTLALSLPAELWKDALK